MSKKIYVCDYCGSEFDDVVGLSFITDTSLYDSDAGWDVND